MALLLNIKISGLLPGNVLEFVQDILGETKYGGIMSDFVLPKVTEVSFEELSEKHIPFIQAIRQEHEDLRGCHVSGRVTVPFADKEGKTFSEEEAKRLAEEKYPETKLTKAVLQGERSGFVFLVLNQG